MYRFDTGDLEEASWLDYGYGGPCSDLYDPARPSRWYIAKPVGDGWEAKRTEFLLADFDSRTVTPLPLAVHGGTAGLLAVSETGQILFVYSYRGERSFGLLNMN